MLTSPPYWGLRDYGGGSQQLGHEYTVDAYVARLVEVFRAVRRVLADDGVVWLNLGDTYSHGIKGSGGTSAVQANNPRAQFRTQKFALAVPPKNLVGVPWRVAFALQDDGWILRNDVIWRKRNGMVESVTDRLTRGHEHVFLLVKLARYQFSCEAIGTPLSAQAMRPRRFNGNYAPPGSPPGAHTGINGEYACSRSWANRRDVWDVPNDSVRSRAISHVRHSATFPPALAELCIRAGSREGDLVLDPFAGTGTAGEVALRLRRRFVGVELSQEYSALARARCRAVRQKKRPATPKHRGP